MRNLPAQLRARPRQKARACAPSWELPPLRFSAACPAGLCLPRDTRASPKSETGLRRDAGPTPHLPFLSATPAPRENCRVRPPGVPAIPPLPRRPARWHLLLPTPGSRRHGRAGSRPAPRLPPVFPERTRESFPASRTAIHPSMARPAAPGSCPPWTPCRRASPDRDRHWCRTRLPRPPECIRPRTPTIFERASAPARSRDRSSNPWQREGSGAAAACPARRPSAAVDGSSGASAWKEAKEP